MIEKYYGDIVDGKIPACEKLKKQADRILETIANPDEFHYDAEIAQYHIEFIERFCKIPSGALGAPFKLEPFQKAMLQVVFGFVDDNNYRQYNEVFEMISRKNGKAVSLDTEIATPSGWKKMKDIEENDFVFGQDGKMSKVLYVSPIFNKPMYLVEFEDGAKVKASADHIWTVQTKNSRSAFNRKLTGKNGWSTKEKYRTNNGWYEVTTEEMLGDYARVRADGKGTEYKYRVPMNNAVEYGEKDLPLDPYTLGVWLGDGTKKRTDIAVSMDDLEETKKNLENEGHSIKVRYPRERTPLLGIDIGIKGHPNPTRDALREIGVFRNKHIPEIYMQSSVEQRFALLQGLMDTDGYCSKKGQCEFAQKDEHITDQVRELLSSLGIKNSKRRKTIYCNGKECFAYSVLFYTDKNHSCFRLKRKTERLKEKLADRMKAKSIIAITEIPNEPSKCIMIDNESHLYLVGREFTATHNTSLCSAIELDMLCNDGEGAPQVYNIATMLDQAKLGFNACDKMRQMSPELNGILKKRAADIYFPDNMGFIKALASNTSSLDGLDVHCAIIDELSAIKNRDIYDLIKQAMSARVQPLLFCITTNGFLRDGIFDNQYDYAKAVINGDIQNKRFLPIIYELDAIDEWRNPESWIKANPGLGTIKSYDKLKENVDKAIDDASFQPTVVTKDFNMKQTNSAAWLKWEELDNEAAWDMSEFKYCIGGFDAADSVDLNAAKALCMRPNDPNIYVESMYWLPEDVIEQIKATRRERDNAPYQLWVQQGWLRTCHGNKCDKRIFLDWFKELRERGLYTLYIGYDPWHISDELLREFQAEFGKKSMIPVRQGFKTESEPLKEIKTDFQGHRIIYNNNPIDKWCFANSCIKTDVNGNQMLVKNADRRNRNDGTSALLDGYVVLMNYKDKFINLNDEVT